MIFQEMKAGLIAGAIIGGGVLLGLGYLHWRDAQREIGAAPYRAQVQAMRDAALQASARVAETEKRLQAAQAEQTKKDGDNEKTIADLGRKLRDAGRLRDPGTRGSSCPSSETAPGATPGTGDDAQGPGVLSAELSDMLRTWAAEADAVNIAYASCRADALNVRQ